MDGPATPPAAEPPAAGRLARFAAVCGPGLAVMLADADVGSIITAGQSGVQWGYRLLPVQLLLIPVLFVAQELTVRLGVFTGRGHGALVCATFGPAWGYLCAAALALATTGALLSEFSGVAAVGELYGVSRLLTLPLACTCLLAAAASGAHRRVERAAIAIGLFELAFFVVAWRAHPALADMAAQALDMRLQDREFRTLVAANIGAVIAPWMVFYQQAAVARRLRPADLAAARADTAIGAVVSQLVLAAVLVACAATLGKLDRPARLGTVGAMAGALTPLLGAATGRLVFSLGVIGAGMVAAIVASLALAWGVGEVAGFGRPPGRTAWFRGAYAACILGVAGVVAAAPDLVALNIGVQVMNALLLPLVLGTLVALSARALPPAVRLRGAYLWLVTALLGTTAALGVLSVGTGLL